MIRQAGRRAVVNRRGDISPNIRYDIAQFELYF